MKEFSINYQELASTIMSGEYVCDISNKVWVSAIQYAVENIDQFSFDADSMHMLWIVNGGHIRRHISDDKLILKWLKLILPKYEGGELHFIVVNANSFMTKA
ncbi:hypothetical protein ACY4HN_003599 [Vibrio cholerae]|uniref:hypothetical protein n=1 Tax=Vibrio cholerae TaxID=666 RepID=UPI00345907EB